MISNDKIIQDMLFSDIVEKFAGDRNIEIAEARSMISQLSFGEYHSLLEGSTIVPPSGNTIGPSAQAQKPGTTGASTAPSSAQSTWTGKGPVQIGMTVGVNGPNNTPTPRSVSKVDSNTNGVVVKDPVTGKEETMNMSDLQPFMVQKGQTQNIQPGAPTTEDSQLMRLRELAGIKENCSAGATGAGAIAIAPAAMGTKKRQATDEELKKEYTRTTPAKTIVGDTKPSQASGELSANLSASGKGSANRRARK